MILSHPLFQTLRELKGNPRVTVLTEVMFGIPYNLFAPFFSVYMLAFGITDQQITKAVESVFSFKPADIVKQLKLLRPVYSKSTNYGHFGKSDKDLTWEATDKVAALKKAVG